MSGPRWYTWFWDAKIFTRYFSWGAGLGFGATVALVLLHLTGACR